MANDTTKDVLKLITNPPKQGDKWQDLAKAAEEVAKTRRILYLAYVKEGFTSDEAIDLLIGDAL